MTHLPCGFCVPVSLLLDPCSPVATLLFPPLDAKLGMLA